MRGIYKVYLYNYREKKEFWKCLFMMKKKGVTLLFFKILLQSCATRERRRAFLFVFSTPSML